MCSCGAKASLAFEMAVEEGENGAVHLFDYLEFIRSLAATAVLDGAVDHGHKKWREEG